VFVAPNLPSYDLAAIVAALSDFLLAELTDPTDHSNAPLGVCLPVLSLIAGAEYEVRRVANLQTIKDSIRPARDSLTRRRAFSTAARPNRPRVSCAIEPRASATRVSRRSVFAPRF
jgi:hypothetical protein